MSVNNYVRYQGAYVVYDTYVDEIYETRIDNSISKISSKEFLYVCENNSQNRFYMYITQKC